MTETAHGTCSGPRACSSPKSVGHPPQTADAEAPAGAHCAFCTRPLRSGRSTKRFCTNRCRAADSKRRSIYASVRASLERMLRDPTFADELPIEIAAPFVDALDLLRLRLVA